MVNVRLTILLLINLLLYSIYTNAQTVSCPPNIDFEAGNFNNWNLYTGTCCPISTGTLSGAITGRHTLMSGSATDFYGGFPVVAPSGGVYSLKLGNSSTGAQAERARYYVRVPSGVNNYSIIFRYAVVFEDPSHTASEQPRFEVKAYDSATNTVIPCSHFTYVASSSIPGFTLSGMGLNVYYKSWTTASLNLSGYAGRTVAVDFASGDCDLGAHFGYGYVDLNCGLFQIGYNACDTASTVTLSAPPGFSSYSWRDSSTMSVVGTGQSITITRPATTTTYAVILTPYTGFGCPDTLYTRVTINNLTVNATNDTNVCRNTTLQLNAGASANATPLTYSWTPTTNLSCSTCANPVATIAGDALYRVTVTDANGCSKSDSVRIRYSNLSSSHSIQNVGCHGDSTGSITVTPAGGRNPYSYSWNTTPVKTTATATNLKQGTYIVTITDSIGCTKNDTGTVTQPSPLDAAISTIKNTTCYNGNDGMAVATATGGTSAYTYSWNTTPPRTGDTARNLNSGTYTVTVTDNKGCKDTATAIVAQPTILAANVTAHGNANCNGGTGWAAVSATGGTGRYTYSWNTTPVQTTDTARNLAAGTYTATVTDSNGCQDTAIIVITQPSTLNASVTASTGLNCFAGSNATATVTATGGTGPYTYSWNTTPNQTTATATGLSAGNYIATVTDNLGCSDTALVIIAQPALLDARISASSNINCNGNNNGSATVSVSGGTPSYTYSWNTTPVQTTTSISSLTPGNYVVTVTDSKGCTDTAAVTITQPNALTASATTTNITCFGSNNGTATAVVNGGTTPYTYSWTTTPSQTTATATGLSAGTYIVTVTDNQGCADTAVATITQPLQLIANITAGRNVSCYGNSDGWALVQATGGTGAYTYSWNMTPAQTTDTAKNLAAGTYIATVTDTNGCTDTATIIITQPLALNISVTGANVSCYNGNNGSATVTVTGGTAPYTYSWNTLPVQTTATATGLTAGTYSVTVTDANNCTRTASVTLTQPTALNASITSFTNTSCNPANTGSATVAATGGTAPYTYSWNTLPVQTTATATTLPAGVYIATVTDNKGCTDTAMVTISQPTTLTASISAITYVNCNGGNNGAATVSVSGGTSPYTYSWNTTPAATTTTITSLTAGNYIATVTDALGCTDTALATVTEPAILNASIANSSNANCASSATGWATVGVTGGTAPYTYSWNTIPVQTTATATSLAAGAYIATVTDSKGCTDTAIIIIAQPIAVNAAITSKSDVSCNGTKTGSATVTVTGGLPGYTYSWNTTPVQTTATATNLAAGTYIVTATDSRGCTDTAVVAISQPTILDAGISSYTNVSCNSGTNGSATVSASGGTSPYTYSWNTTPPQTGATATGLAAGNYRGIITDNKGCLDTVNVTITQPATLLAAISTTSDVSCYAGNNGSVGVSVSGGTTPYTYSWNTTPVQTTASATALPAGNYNVIVRDAKGCADTASATISQPPLLDAVLTGTTNAKCNGDANGAANITVSGGTVPYTYSWNTAPPQTTQNAGSLLAGTYTVTVTDGNGCMDTVRAVITEPAPFTITAAGMEKTCERYSDGSAKVTGISGGAMPLVYSWNTTPVQTTDSAIKLPAGTYTVKVTDANGCEAIATADVQNYPKPDLHLTPDQYLCIGNDISLEAEGGVIYHWTPPATLTCPTCPKTKAKPTVTTTYTVDVVDSNNCPATGKVAITVLTKGEVAVGPPQEVCEGTNIQLYARGGSEYTWWPGSSLNNANSATPLSSATTSTLYHVAIKQNECFTDTLSQMVNVVPMPTIDLGPDREGVAGQEITLDAKVTNATRIAWSPTSGLSCADCYSPKLILERTVKYTATVYNSLGCEAKDDITITVNCDQSILFVPNTFTPNGDGVNDRFYPSIRGVKTIKALKVYNRWGQMLYEAYDFPANDPNYGWDGTFKNQELTPDVFVYMIETQCASGERIFTKGDISLIR